MRVLIFLIFTFCLYSQVFTQGNFLKGTIIPSSKDGAILVLPNATQNIKSENSNTNASPKSKKELKKVYIPTPIFSKVKVFSTNQFNQNNNSAVKSSTINQTQNNNTQSSLTKNWIGSKPTNSNNFNEEVDTIGATSNDVPSLLIPVVKKYEQPKPTKVLETLDPQRDYPGATSKAYVDILNNSKTSKMPDLSPIDQADIKNYKNNQSKAPTNNTSMIDLAAIDGQGSQTKSTAIQNGMIDLAAIDGQGSQTKSTANQNGMIDLAPVDGNDTRNGISTLAGIENIRNTQTGNSVNKTGNPEKGFSLPKGTILASQLGLSFIIKPTIPKPNIDSTKYFENERLASNYKPSAGGGMIDLSPIETNNVSTQSFLMPDLAPIESQNIMAQETMPNLFAIEAIESTQQYNRPTQQYVQTKAAAKTVQPPCPCLPPRKKKYYPPKKRTYSYYKKPTATQSANVIKYVPQPSQTIIYVPVQQQSQQATPKQQPVYQEPVKQTSNERIVYKDYTNTYSKKEVFNNNCNCNQPKPGNRPKDPSTTYNPANYQGVAAGPTSGDYPVTSLAGGYESGMKYAFYVNRKGKYSVAVYNNYVNILMGMDGKILEYKINDAQNQANSPKLNYFGSAESVGGIPIEYNYNRTVHKIGNVEMTYDFEGFLKSVGNSKVLYNSKSSLSQVDNVYVTYSDGSAVNSSPPNNGLIFVSGN